MKYKVKNWTMFQHYRDRNPPWIKLHFSLLSSHDWVMLDDASRVLAISIMLIASRNGGEIDGSDAGLDYLQRVAYLKRKPSLKPLIDCGFLECASKEEQMLADARPEERHILKEEDIKKDRGERARFTPPTLQEVEQYCLERKNGINAQTFIDFYKTNGWMQSNKPVKDWQACVRTWEAREKEKNKFTGSTYTGIPRPSKDLYGFQRYLKDNHIQGKPGEENESIYQRLLREARQ